MGDYVEDGRPTECFRHDVPTFLTGVHKTLVQYGYAMGKRYGKGFKRNIRFDDIDNTFCIDVKMPAEKEWFTVSYETALADQREARRETDRSRRQALSSRGGSESDAETPKDSAPPASIPPSESGTRRSSTADRTNKTWGQHRGQ